jgi:hypothetical protein
MSVPITPATSMMMASRAAQRQSQDIWPFRRRWLAAWVVPTMSYQDDGGQDEHALDWGSPLRRDSQLIVDGAPSG